MIRARWWSATRKPNFTKRTTPRWGEKCYVREEEDTIRITAFSNSKNQPCHRASVQPALAG